MKVAVFTPYLPYPPDTGGKIRSYYLLQALTARFDVDLYTIYHGKGPSEEHVRALREHCRRVVLFRLRMRGPPDEQSIELARVVDRGIRHADCVQTKKLCIKENEAVYILFIDMYVINYEGNLIDCGGVSALTTLISTHIPEGIWTEENGLQWTGKYLTGDQIVNELPLVITYGKIDDIIFLDPILAEELVCDGRISISVTENNITSIQKSGASTFSFDEIKMLCKKSIEIGQKLRKELNFWQYKTDIK